MGAISIASFHAGVQSAGAAAPVTCSIGDLVPLDLNMAATASWSSQLVVGTPATLTIDLDLGSGLAELPNLAGDLREVTVSVADPAFDFTGGQARLGDGASSTAGEVSVNDNGAIIVFDGPIGVSRERPLPRLVAELDVVPTFPGRVAIDTEDVTIAFVLFATGIREPFESECVASVPQDLVITTVSPPSVEVLGEHVDAEDRPAPVDMLPTTGPTAATWISVAIGLVAIDLGWAAWSLVGGPRQTRFGRRRSGLRRGLRRPIDS